MSNYQHSNNATEDTWHVESPMKRANAKKRASKVDTIPLVYQSASSEFSLKIFIVELLLSLFPFLVLPFYKVLGLNPKLHGFTKMVPILIFINWISPLLSYIMIISYCLVDRNPKSHQDGYSDFTPIAGSIALPLICVIVHRLCVALKYACLSRSEYEAINKDCETDEDQSNIQNQIQTIDAWQMRSNVNIMKFEIASSAVLAGIDLSMLNFTVDSPEKLSKSAYSQWMNWKKFLFTAYKGPNDTNFEAFNVNKYLTHHQKHQECDGSGSGGGASGYYSISLLNVAIALMKTVSERAKTQTPPNFHRDYFYGLMNIFTIISIVIPLLFLIQYRVYSPWIIVYYITSSILTLLFFRFGFQFIGQTYLDSNRRIEEAKILRYMMRVSDVHLSDNIDGSVKTFGNIIVALKNVHTYHDMNEEELFTDTEWSGTSFDQTDKGGDVASSTAKMSTFKKTEYIAAEKKVRELFYDSTELSFVPKLVLDTTVGPRNIIAWNALCEIMRLSGARFISKFGFYLLLGIIVTVIMVGIMISILSNPSDSVTHGSMRLISPLFFQSAALCIFGFIVIIITSFSTAAVNLEYSRHRHILQCNLLNLEDINVKKNELVANKFERVIKSLQVADGAIALLCELKPYLFIAVPATFTLTSSIISVVLSLLSTVLGIYFKNKHLH